MEENKLTEELLGETTTPIKTIPIVSNTPQGLTPGNIWFNKGTKKLSVVKTDNTIVELSGNSKLVNKVNIVPEYMSIVKYDNLGYKVTFDFDTVPTASSGRTFTKEVDFNIRTNTFVYLTTDARTIQVYNIQTRTVRTLSSSKDIISFHCSLDTNLCYVRFSDNTVGYFDLVSGISISQISLPSSVTVRLIMNTKYAVYIVGTDNKLYRINAGNTTVEDTGVTDVETLTTSSNSQYLVFGKQDGVYVYSLENPTVPRKVYPRAWTDPTSCLFDPTTENMYKTGNLIQTWPVSKTGSTHYLDIHLNGMNVEFFQLVSKNVALSYDGNLYVISNFNNYRKIQLPAPVYRLVGYDDYVILVDKNGDVHYFSVRNEQVVVQSLLNIRNSTSFSMIVRNRLPVINTSNPTYSSSTPDSDYYSAKAITLTLPSTYNYSYPVKIIKFSLTDTDIIQNMTSNYNNVVFKFNNYRIPFKMVPVSSTQYDIYLLISDPITTTSITVVCNYQPKINYPSPYTLDKRQSVGFTNNPSVNGSHNMYSIPVYISKTQYSKYRMKIITYPSNNVLFSWLFNDQFPLMKRTRLLGRTFYTSTVPCAGVNSDITLLISEIEVENIPNKGVVIKSTLVRPETIDIREFSFIPSSELQDENGYYKLGTVYTEGSNIPSYVVVTRIM